MRSRSVASGENADRAAPFAGKAHCSMATTTEYKDSRIGPSNNPTPGLLKKRVQEGNPGASPGKDGWHPLSFPGTFFCWFEANKVSCVVPNSHLTVRMVKT
jgi:hypothetical protein